VGHRDLQTAAARPIATHLHGHDAGTTTIFTWNAIASPCYRMEWRFRPHTENY